MNFVLVLFCAFGCVLAENCNTLGVHIYEDLNCTPIKQGDQGCPEKFNCDLLQTRNTGECLFRGKWYKDSESVDSNSTGSSCNVGCFCRSGEFQCAILDCFGERIKPGCHPKNVLGSCCTQGQVCPSETPFECEINGTKYKLGETFELGCRSCVCHEGFTGKLDEKTCEPRNCAVQIRHTDSIRKKCAPGYLKHKGDDLCCPLTWICPEPSDKIITISTIKGKQTDLTCEYGEKLLKLGEGLQGKIDDHYGKREFTCECIMPPFVTCWQVKGPEDWK